MENNETINTNVIIEDNDNKKKKLFIKIIVFLSISFLIILITLINMSRIVMFSNIFGSVLGNTKALGLIIYLLATILFFLYYVTLGTLILVHKLKLKKDWYPLINKIDSKLDMAAFISKCFSILLFLLIFIATPCVVVGNSMYDTLENGDALLSTNLFYTPKKGDIVIFDSHDYQESSYDESSHSFYIKRVMAVKDDVLSFDYVTLTFYINGEEIYDFERGDGSNTSVNSWYNIIESINDITNEYTSEELNTLATITVPKGYLLVFGDNRKNSLDSRIFGVISTKSVFGKAFLRIFPFSKFGSI